MSRTSSSRPDRTPGRNWRNFSDRIIRPGDIVIIDLAALTWNGFKSCYYRTYCVGGNRPTESTAITIRPRSSGSTTRSTRCARGRRLAKIAMTMAVGAWRPGAMRTRIRPPPTSGGMAWVSRSTTMPVISRIWSLDFPQDIKPGMVFALETQHGKVHEFGRPDRGDADRARGPNRDHLAVPGPRDHARRLNGSSSVRTSARQRALPGRAAGRGQSRAARPRLRARLPGAGRSCAPVFGHTAILAEASTTIPGRGVHHGRFEVMARDASEFADLGRLVRELGEPLAVRSSSPLEDDGTTAGAFTSFLGVAAAELGTAILGVWASALRRPDEYPTPGAQRAESAHMGVVIQRASFPSSPAARRSPPAVACASSPSPGRLRR